MNLLYLIVFPSIFEHTWKLVTQAPPTEHRQCLQSSAWIAPASLSSHTLGYLEYSQLPKHSNYFTTLYTNSYALQRKEVVITKIKLFLFAGSINTHVTNIRNFLTNIYRYRKTLRVCFSRLVSILLLLLILRLKTQNIYINRRRICYTWRETCSKIPSSCQKGAIWTTVQKQYHADKLFPGKSISSWQWALLFYFKA